MKLQYYLKYRPYIVSLHEIFRENGNLLQNKICLRNEFLEKLANFPKVGGHL
jgi:hypothetical protein